VLDKDKKDVRGTYLKRSDLQRKLSTIKQLSDTDFEALKRSIDNANKILPGMVFLDYIMGRSGHDQVLISDAELPVGLIVEYFNRKRCLPKAPVNLHRQKRGREDCSFL